MLHLLSFIVMLYRMRSQRSCRGVSLKSQILFLIVFCCRYLVIPMLRAFCLRCLGV